MTQAQTQTSSSSNNNDAPHTKEMTVLVIGGGPSGASAAKALADRGYTNVNLYEAYPPPQSLAKTSSLAYLIALNPRGLKGIRDATKIDVLAEAQEAASNTNGSTKPRGVPSYDMARHVYSAKSEKTSTRAMNHKDHPFCLIPRKALTERLLEGAHESGVEIHYQHRLAGIDFESKVATFTTESGETEVKYDLLLAADGSNSKVRNLMVEVTNDENNKSGSALGGFRVRTAEDSMEYQVAVLPSNPFEESLPEGCVHSWNNKEQNSICLGFPMHGNSNNSGDKTSGNDTKHSLLLAVVYPEGQLKTFRETGYEAPLSKLLPDLSQECLAGVASQLRQNQIGNGGLCVWPSALGHGDSGVILLGDAAHGMWPSLGQGANCALETVGVFVECLDEQSKSQTKAQAPQSIAGFANDLLGRYQEARLEDAIAAVDLTYGGIGARETRGRLNAPLSAKLQMVGMILLSKLTAGVVPMPALLRVMGGHEVSYKVAKKWHFGYEKKVCLAAAATTTLVSALGLWFGVLGGGVAAPEL